MGGELVQKNVMTEISYLETDAVQHAQLKQAIPALEEAGGLLTFVKRSVEMVLTSNTWNAMTEILSMETDAMTSAL